MQCNGDEDGDGGVSYLGPYAVLSALLVESNGLRHQRHHLPTYVTELDKAYV